MNKHHPGERPCRGGLFARLNFKTPRVRVYKCMSLIVGFAVTVAISFYALSLTFWVMSLVRLYPGRASGESFLFISLKKLELTDALLSHSENSKSDNCLKTSLFFK